MKSQPNKRTRFRSESGSALLMALAAVAFLGLMASASLTIASLMNSDAQRKSQAKAVNHFIQSLEAVASNNLACVGAGQGQNRLRGLRFDGNSPDNACDVNCMNRGRGTGSLEVHLDTTLGSDAGAGQHFYALGIRVDHLYLTDVRDVGPSTYSARLVAQVSSLDPVFSFAPREVGTMQLQFDGASRLVSCLASPSAQSLCESMSCVFNPTAPQGRQRCSCSFPEMACGAGEYISGFDPNAPPNGQPICTRVALNCADTHGPGYFFAGVDHQGAPICLAVEGTLGAPPAQLNCLADGDSSGGDHVFADNSYNFTVWSGSGGPENTSLCCSGNGWARSPSCPGMNCSSVDSAVTCGPPPNGQLPIAGRCGPANGNTYNNANQVRAAGLCDAGNLRADISGNGPSWSWDCDGTNGGANASCSTLPANQGPTQACVCYSAGSDGQCAARNNSMVREVRSNVSQALCPNEDPGGNGVGVACACFWEAL